MSSNFESRTVQKTKRKAAFAVALRCSRTALLCLAGVAAGSFIVLPASFALQATPTPYNGNVVIAGTPIPSIAAAPTPTPYVPANTPLQAEPVVKDVHAPGTVQYVQLQFGDTNATVMEIQSRLMELGYFDNDEPTDYFGPATEAAAKRFQHVHHMAETGVADEMFQSVLFSDNALPYVMEEGDKGSDVTRLQLRLDELGYYEGNINGYFGTATVRALTAFQKKNGLTEDAKADTDTCNTLYSGSAKPKIDPTPTPKPTKKPTPKPTNKPSSSATNAPSYTNSGGSGGSKTIPVIGSGVDALISAAKSKLGSPYVWSEEGPDSFDCSGLVYFSLRSAGMSVGRYSAAGYSQVSSWQNVSFSELQKGDLIFFRSDTSASISHTGIWLGGNSYIHASSSAGKVVISSWSDWANRNFVLGKRVW
ncbi:MAG TPA: peptidoglycan-binding protein [Clostridia bacterium]|nr:peptidoglycan-binding protein [Clostridia bacterium]